MQVTFSSGSPYGVYRNDTGAMVAVVYPSNPMASTIPSVIISTSTDYTAFDISYTYGTQDVKKFTVACDGTQASLPRFEITEPRLKLYVTLKILNAITSDGAVVAVSDNSFVLGGQTPAMGDESATNEWPWPFVWSSAQADTFIVPPNGLPAIEPGDWRIGWFSAAGVWRTLPAALIATTETASPSWTAHGAIVVSAAVNTKKSIELATVSVPEPFADELGSIVDSALVFVNKTRVAPSSVSVDTAGANYYIKITTEWRI